MPAYTLNEDAVKHAKRLIDARRYVLRSIGDFLGVFRSARSA